MTTLYLVGTVDGNKTATMAAQSFMDTHWRQPREWKWIDPEKQTFRCKGGMNTYQLKPTGNGGWAIYRVEDKS